MAGPEGRTYVAVMFDYGLTFWLLTRLLAEKEGLPAKPAPPPVTAAVFARDVRPILERRCQPCHFEGGKMYARLPFDRPETITGLGEKLFTRIKDANDQKTIRAFLARR